MDSTQDSEAEAEQAERKPARTSETIPVPAPTVVAAVYYQIGPSSFRKKGNGDAPNSIMLHPLLSHRNNLSLSSWTMAGCTGNGDVIDLDDCNSTVDSDP